MKFDFWAVPVLAAVASHFVGCADAGALGDRGNRPRSRGSQSEGKRSRSHSGSRDEGRIPEFAGMTLEEKKNFINYLDSKGEDDLTDSLKKEMADGMTLEEKRDFINYLEADEDKKLADFLREEIARREQEEKRNRPTSRENKSEDKSRSPSRSKEEGGEKERQRSISRSKKSNEELNSLKKEMAEQMAGRPESAAAGPRYPELDVMTDQEKRDFINFFESQGDNKQADSLREEIARREQEEKRNRPTSRENKSEDKSRSPSRYEEEAGQTIRQRSRSRSKKTPEELINELKQLDVEAQNSVIDLLSEQQLDEIMQAAGSTHPPWRKDDQ